MVDVLDLVLHHDEQAVLAAVEMALDAGVPPKTHILNLLHRLVDGKSTAIAPVEAPQTLVLGKATTQFLNACTSRQETHQRGGTPAAALSTSGANRRAPCMLI